MQLLFWQGVSHVLSLIIICCILVKSYTRNLFELMKTRKPKPIANPLSESDLKRQCLLSEEYYITHEGFKHQSHFITTNDGFVLKLIRISKLSTGVKDYKSKGVVLLVHGLFQSSGVFISCGAQSLPFQLVEAGYDVWLCNNRCCDKLRVLHNPGDKECWDWSLDELAKYDFPSLVEYVSNQTGGGKISYIGHSQGTAQAFLGLSLDPKIADKLNCLVALAPAAYLGPLIKQGTLRNIMNCPPKVFQIIFGTLCFIPLMNFVQAVFPPSVFTAFAYHVFNYLFHWTDTNWDPANKNVFFRFTPRPTSSKALLHWTQMAQRGHIGVFDASLERDPTRMIASRFDISAVRCPLACFYGRKDTIIDGDRFVRECRNRNLNLVHGECIDGYEHMDVIWAADAPTLVFKKIVDILGAIHS